MNVKQLFRDYQLKEAALLLAERCLQLGESPVFKNPALKTMYDYYSSRLVQPLPKPGDTVLFYDPIDDQFKPAKVVESRDSMSLDQPKLIKCECEGQTLKLQDQHIYRLLYW